MLVRSAAVVLLMLAGGARAQSTAPGGMPPPPGMGLAQSAAMRFPQPVRVGDLPGRAVLQPVEAQTVLGRVRAVVRDRAGGVSVVIGLRRWWMERVVAVPVEAMVLVGDVMEVVAFTPEELWLRPVFDPAGDGSGGGGRGDQGGVGEAFALTAGQYRRAGGLGSVLRLRKVSAGGKRYAVTPERALAGGWRVLGIWARGQPAGWIATVAADTAPEGEPPMMLRSVGFGGVRVGLTFVRPGTRRVEVGLHGSTRPAEVRLLMVPVPRMVAAGLAFLQDPRVFVAAFRTGGGSPFSRLRRALLAVLVTRPLLQETYVNWISLFDDWSEHRTMQIRGTAAVLPALAAVVFHSEPQSVALAATLASLAEQEHPLALVRMAGPGRTGGIAEAAAAAAFVIVLQAGEVLPAHAALVLAAELAAGPADVLLADEDRISPAGHRSAPWFKPQPNLTLMCSGVLSRGVWVVRSGLLAGEWAEAARLGAWFGMGREGSARRVAHVLTHRREDAEAAPASVLKTVVDAGLRGWGLGATVSAGFPMRLQWEVGARGRVSLIVPSRLRGAVQLACLEDVLARTAYPAFEMLVVVTQEGPLDQEQAEAARLLEGTGLARVTVLERGSFNYSVANNVGVAQSAGEFVCLLNDDVSTLEGDWLARMVAIMSDPAVGIVGAKLYYEDMTTQHGGVIIGLGGLADHVSRKLKRGAPGYMGRAVLDQEMSVVTGACLLVRRRLYEGLGGLDEALASAFNDVDFCLRVREAGHRVVFAGSVELVHHETISFGHHYAGRAEQEAVEVRLMQKRWAHVCAADPFHNPNLSLVPGKEWELAFPPRGDGLSPVPYVPAS